MKQLIFTCEITKYKLEFLINTEGKYAILNTVLSDYKQFKALMALIRTSIDKLKGCGIEKIRQSIYRNEWKSYLKNKTTWEIINNDEKMNIYDLECNINDFLNNFGIGLGLDKF